VTYQELDEEPIVDLKIVNPQPKYAKVTLIPGSPRPPGGWT